MLKVSVTKEERGVWLDVEGRLAGPWVSELESCWQAQQGRPAGRLGVRLSGVSFIDEAGKELLARMFHQGTRLEGNGCMIRAILAGITGEQTPS